MFSAGAFRLHIEDAEGNEVNEEYKGTVDNNQLDDPMMWFADPSEMTDIFNVRFDVVKLVDLFRVRDILVEVAPKPWFMSIDLDVFSTEHPTAWRALHNFGMHMRYQQTLHNIMNRDGVNYDLKYWLEEFKPLESQCPSLWQDLSEEGAPIDELEEHFLAPKHPEVAMRYDENSYAKSVYDRAISVERQEIDAHIDHELLVRLLQPFADQFEQAEEYLGEEEVANYLRMVLDYPMHIGTPALVRLMLNTFQCLFGSLGDHGIAPPGLILMCRSPMYTPLHLLPYIECPLYDLLRTTFPGIEDLYHDLEYVDPLRVCSPNGTLFHYADNQTNAEAHVSLRFANPPYKLHGVKDLHSVGHFWVEDEDLPGGGYYGGMHGFPNEDGPNVIELIVTNDTPETLYVVWNSDEEEEKENEEPSSRLEEAEVRPRPKTLHGGRCCEDVDVMRLNTGMVPAWTRQSFIADHTNLITITTREEFVVTAMTIDRHAGHTQIMHVTTALVAKACEAHGVQRHYEL
jgi:hypothetical protein